MKLKDFKKEIQNEELNIPDVKDSIKNSSEFKNRKIYEEPSTVPFSRRNVLRLSFAAVMVVLIAVVSIVCTKTSYQAPVKYSSTSLKYVKNSDDLKQLLSFDATPEYLDNDYSPAGWFTLYSGDSLYMAKGAMVAPGAADIIEKSNSIDESKGNDISKTNNQVENVDEADVVKCDGKKIYRQDGYRILVNEIDNGQIGETTTINLSSDENISISDISMYLTNKYLVVLYTGYKREYSNNSNVYYNNYYYPNYRYTNTLNVNIYDIETLELSKSYSSSYSYLDDSRIVNGENDVLYLVFNKYIEQNNNDYKLPEDYIDGKLNQYNYNDICYFDNIWNKSLTFIVSIKLDDELKVNSKLQLGASSWTSVYVTEKSLYFADTMTYYTYNRYVNYDFESSKNVTSIIKYAINDGDITPIASLSTEGTINDQFYMSEYNDYFRVALSEKNHNKVEIYKVVNKDDSLEFELTGKVDKDLGEKNEEIKSVTFRDDYCLVVTAKSTDPMYKIDLSDPTNPTILGKFKEEGYNSYLQYLTGDLEGLAFGLGYLTHDISETYNVRDASKLGLYDVTGDNPVQLDLITYYSTNGVEATYNHKALFVYKNFIGFAVNDTYILYTIEKIEEEGKESTYKFKEVINYCPKESDNLYYNYIIARAYYVNGYIYIITSNYNYGSGEFNSIVSYDSEFNLVATVK